MKRRTKIAMAAASVLALAVVWFWLDGIRFAPGAGGGTAFEQGGVRGSAGGVLARREAVGWRGDGEAGSYDPLRPQGMELDDPELVQLLVREVPQRIYSASAFCYGEEPGDLEKIRFRFQVEIVDRKGRLRDVEVHSSNLNAPALEQCVANKLRALKWNEKWSPDGDFPGEVEMTMRGLRQRSRFLAAIPR